MGKAYSVDLRSRVMADYDAGIKPVELVRRYHVARSWIYKLIDQRRELGHIEPLKGEMGRKPKLKHQDEQLRKLVAQHPDATLEELRQKLPVRVGTSTLWRALDKLKLTLKKSHSRGRTKTPRCR
jgi:transposase